MAGDPVKPGELTYERRLSLALKRICGESPPADLVAQWVAHQNNDLQDWAAQNDPFGWVMGIAIIDAAECMACGVVGYAGGGGTWDDIPRNEPGMSQEKARMY